MNRFPHGLESGEVDHGIDRILLKDREKLGGIAAIGLHEGNLRTRDPAHAFHGRHLRIRQIVGDHHVVARFDQLHGGMGTDITRAARYQYSFFHSFYVLDQYL